MAFNTPTTLGLWHMSRNEFLSGENSICDGDLNGGMAEVAAGLYRLNEALLATLTQMSADIAELKAEVALLKARPTFGPQAGTHYSR